MKRTILLFLLIAIAKLTIAQSISPVLTNEYCPDTETTFSVSIPGTYSNIIGLGG